MSEITTTTTEGLDRGDLLTRLDILVGNTIERAAQAEQLPQSVARAIRRNHIQRIRDSIIDARRITEAARAHDKG